MAAFSRATGDHDGAAAGLVAAKGGGRAAGKIDLVPVEVVPPTRSASDGVMEVVIGDVRIRVVEPGFDTEALRRPLAVVAEPAC